VFALFAPHSSLSFYASLCDRTFDPLSRFDRVTPDGLPLWPRLKFLPTNYFGTGGGLRFWRSF
jgi:hypothetical protein